MLCKYAYLNLYNHIVENVSHKLAFAPKQHLRLTSIHLTRISSSFGKRCIGTPDPAAVEQPFTEHLLFTHTFDIFLIIYN